MIGENNPGFNGDSSLALDDSISTHQSKEEEDSELEKAKQKEKRQERILIYKNVLLISMAFLLLFVAFESMSMLQSSINTEANLGTFSNSSVYFCLILSCMFLPSILIKWLKLKWTMVVCVFCYTSYIAAQFYPRFYTLIPTAIVLGMGAAPLWTAKCSYLTQLAYRLASIDGVDAEPIVVKVFGIFFFFFQSNFIIGNIISTEILSQGRDEISNLTDNDLLFCGSNYCPTQIISEEAIDSNATGGENENFIIDEGQIYKLAGIYLGCSICAALLIAFFVDPISRFGEDTRRKGEKDLTILQLLVATFRQMCDDKQLLIIPLTFWSGIESGILRADFTAGFVTCAYGPHVIGRVLICYGICDALSSVSFDYVVKVVGRVPVFILGAIINISVIIVMFSWQPTLATQPVVYVLAALWGVGDAVWQTQLNALYGVLFKNNEEAAFSNFGAWSSMGFLLSFLTQACGVCVFPKLILAVIFLASGMTGYLVLELRICRQKAAVWD